MSKEMKHDGDAVVKTVVASFRLVAIGSGTVTHTDIANAPDSASQQLKKRKK